MGQGTTNRAERRRNKKDLDRLESRIGDPAVQTAALVTVNKAIAVLMSEFGFGDGRIQKFIDGMTGEKRLTVSGCVEEMVQEYLQGGKK